MDSEGTRSKGDCFSVGSGSVHAFGVLDSGYSWDLTDEEAYDLGRRSIYHATFRDVASGGLIRGNHDLYPVFIGLRLRDFVLMRFCGFQCTMSQRRDGNVFPLMMLMIFTTSTRMRGSRGHNRIYFLME